jgi:hypothetical protein
LISLPQHFRYDTSVISIHAVPVAAAPMAV